MLVLCELPMGASPDFERRRLSLDSVEGEVALAQHPSTKSAAGWRWEAR